MTNRLTGNVTRDTSSCREKKIATTVKFFADAAFRPHLSRTEKIAVVHSGERFSQLHHHTLDKST